MVGVLEAAAAAAAAAVGSALQLQRRVPVQVLALLLHQSLVGQLLTASHCVTLRMRHFHVAQWGKYAI